MKKINGLIFVFTFLLSTLSFAGKIGIDIGAGTKADSGIVGVGLRYFPNKHFDLYFNNGLDTIGQTTVLGTRIYSPPMGKRCFFFIPCVPLYYFGVYLGSSQGGIITMENDGKENDYEFTSGDFSGVNLGFLDLFGDFFFYSVDIGYRSYTSAPDYELKSGDGDSDNDENFDNYLQSGLSYGLKLGILF